MPAAPLVVFAASLGNLHTVRGHVKEKVKLPPLGLPLASLSGVVPPLWHLLVCTYNCRSRDLSFFSVLAAVRRYAKRSSRAVICLIGEAPLVAAFSFEGCHERPLPAGSLGQLLPLHRWF